MPCNNSEPFVAQLTQKLQNILDLILSGKTNILIYLDQNSDLTEWEMLYTAQIYQKIVWLR